jgi:hypothetical protein
MSFALHHGQQCVLCSGCENDEEFDYCRACGFTKLPLFFPVMKIAKKNEQLREQLAAIAAAQQPLVDALKFYAERENYVDDVLGMPDGPASEVSGSSEINQDGGMKARAALAKVKERK